MTETGLGGGRILRGSSGTRSVYDRPKPSPKATWVVERSETRESWKADWPLVAGEIQLDLEAMRWIIAALLISSNFSVAEEEGEIDLELQAALGGAKQIPIPPNKALDAKGEATTQFFESMQKVRDEYRKNLAKAVEMSDEVHVYLLDHKPIEKVPDGESDLYFPIKPYEAHSKILKTKKLEGKDIAECNKATAVFLDSPDEPGAFCHLPIHGLRFRLKGELVFETSICWMCSNYYVEYPDDFMDGATWVGIGDWGLNKFLNKVMPIPQSEKDRAEKTMNPKKEKK